MKSLYTLLLIFVIGIFYSQSTGFPYLQSWGSYVGGAGTMLYNDYQGKIIIDPQMKIHLSGDVMRQAGYSSAYYNQFVTSNGDPITSSWLNKYFTTFSEHGQMLYGSYFGNNDCCTRRYLAGIDHANNRFYVNVQPNLIHNLATPGVWLTDTMNLSSMTMTLTKYSPNGNIIWTTYLPNYDRFYELEFDENNNLFLIGNTNQEISGLATTGVFQENFITYPATQIGTTNSILIKLNPSGQKIWATYFLSSVSEIAYFNNAIYFVGSYSESMPNILTTSGTFQPTQTANNVLMRFNSNTGQREWGTFYGAPRIDTYSGFEVSDLDVNETGVYVSGQSENTTYPTYFATPGAFKQQLTGGGDLYLSKFDHSGNRLWSTYFGTGDYETLLTERNLSIHGDKIMITGNQYNCAENISTPGVFRTDPGNTGLNHSSMFFAEFDSSGNRLWSSYFGGAGDSGSFEFIFPKYLSDGSFVLYGSTAAPTGVTSEGGHYPTMLNPLPNVPFGYVTRFILKNPLATSETEVTHDWILYDNPNSGNFTLQSSVFPKKPCIMNLYDVSGKLVHRQHLTRQYQQYFELHHQLPKGNYVVEIRHQSTRLKTFKMLVK